MTLAKTCFAGRTITRPDAAGGLDWQRPCPVPAEQVVATVPPMSFCAAHGRVVVDLMWDLLDEAGLIDHGLLGGPADEFDEMIEQLRREAEDGGGR